MINEEPSEVVKGRMSYCRISTQTISTQTSDLRFGGHGIAVECSDFSSISIV